MKCKEFDLEKFLDEELGKAKRLKVEQHLAQCPACRQRLEVLKLQGDLLREEILTAAMRTDFSGFEDRVESRIRLEEPAPLGERAALWLKETLYHYRTVWVTSLVTAAVLLAVLIPVLSGQPEPTRGEPELARVDNEVIIDSMEYAGQRSMIFTVSKNDTTVIWLYDFDRAEEEKTEGDDI
jgi:hypothetical protein